MAIIKEMKFYISSSIDNLTKEGLADGEPERNDITVEGFYKISDEGYEITYSEMTEGGKVVPGSLAFVPSVAGLIAAGEAIKHIIAKEEIENG